ncbi:hypothetical protein F5J12DRAFT_42730 [Pisolithus orientalis]|uniref:uncharacterized protein n=1 Tax=Pisolithus orientalis TaxID=936130 RepID=UPI0022244FA4|nr:uncharacterized protein F5J12DRAFT_42730 [Pisolithus orientalis]KAI6009565.1 hypothetical protein F5J12DRAFT_42730 [Pisolithus orientalis]
MQVLGLFLLSIVLLVFSVLLFTSALYRYKISACTLSGSPIRCFLHLALVVGCISALGLGSGNFVNVILLSAFTYLYDSGGGGTDVILFFKAVLDGNTLVITQAEPQTSDFAQDRFVLDPNRTTVTTLGLRFSTAVSNDPCHARSCSTSRNPNPLLNVPSAL